MATVYALAHIGYPDYDQTKMVLDGLYIDQSTAEQHVDVHNEFGFTYYLYRMQINATPAPLTKSAGMFITKAGTNMTLLKTYPSEKMIQGYPEASQQQVRDSMITSNTTT